jgi:hypothetical protein
MMTTGFERVEIVIQPYLQPQRIPGTDQGQCNLLRIGGCFEFSAVIPALGQICNQLSKIGIGFLKCLWYPTVTRQGGRGWAELSRQCVEIKFYLFILNGWVFFSGIMPA